MIWLATVNYKLISRNPLRDWKNFVYLQLDNKKICKNIKS